MATNATNWQRDFEMTLPSGNVIRLKRVSLLDLIVAGSIPDTLSARAVEMVSQTQARKLDAAELRQYENVVNLVVKAAAVEPRVADRSGDETLAVTEIDFVDRVQIYNWANGAANSLRPFRDQPDGAQKFTDLASTGRGLR